MYSKLNYAFPRELLQKILIRKSLDLENVIRRKWEVFLEQKKLVPKLSIENAKYLYTEYIK